MQQVRRESVGSRGGALVIFGSTGNLATTRIIPAIQRLGRKGLLAARFVTLGVDRRPPEGEARMSGYRSIRGDLRSQETFAALGRLLGEVKGRTGSSVTFYMATGPELFSEIVSRLKEEGLNRSGRGRRRIMVEKPLGLDLESALVLERTLGSTFPARDIFRVDHFLGKEGTDLIQRARFRFPSLGPVWNSHFIDHVQIMADEGFGIGTRGSFYDSTGAVRDMFQNHLLQLLCLVAMNPPEPTTQAGLAKAKARVLRELRMPGAPEVVLGQYRGYSQADGVGKNTRTPTFAAMKLTVDSARWEGVPFYLRTGKALARTATEVVVVFKGSEPMPKELPGGLSSLRICIDPSPRLVIGTRGEEKGESAGKAGDKADEYERLLLDAFDGDQTRFVDRRFNLFSWRLFGPLLRAWEETPSMVPVLYEPNTWGPAAADRLLARDGRFWRDGRSRSRPG